MKRMESEAVSVARALIERIIGEVSSKSNSLYDVGANLGASLAEGLRSMIDEVQRAAQELANAANEAIKDVDTSLKPGDSAWSGNYGEKRSYSAVQPVYDMSSTPSVMSARSGFSTTSGSFDVSNSVANAGRTAYIMNRKDYEQEEHPRNMEPSSIQFVQNNYSPKTLSRIDIYRQTKNLLSQSKEKVVSK